MTMLLVASSLSVVTSAVLFVRGKRFERRGCPRCRGRLERGVSGLRCRTCTLYWTLEGEPVGHTIADEQIPRAEARLRK